MEKNSWKPGESQEKLENIKEVFKDQGYNLDEMDDQQISRLGFHTGFIKTEDGEIEYTKPLLNAQFKPDSGDLAEKLSIDVVELPKRRTRARKVGYKTIAIASDFHIGFRGQDPIHDKRALDAYLQVLNTTNPDLLVNLGDVVDNAVFSRFDPDSNDFLNTFQSTLQETHNILAQQSDATPNAQERIIIAGNHDTARIDKHILKNSPQLHNIRAVGEKYPAMSLPGLLKVDDIGHTWVDGYPNNEFVYNDDIIFRHGNGSGANPTKKMIEQYPNHHVVEGHFHQSKHEYHTQRDGKKYGKFILGTLAKIDGAIPSTNSSMSFGKTLKRYENWSQSIMLINDYGEGNYEFNEIPINEGKAFWQGKKFEGKE